VSHPIVRTGDERMQGSYVRSRRTFLTTLAAFGMDAVATGRLIAQMPPKQGLVDLHHHISPAFLPGMRDYVMAAWRVAGRQQDLPARLSEWSPQNSLAEMDKNGSQLVSCRFQTQPYRRTGRNRRALSLVESTNTVRNSSATILGGSASSQQCPSRTRKVASTRSHTLSMC